MQKNKLKVAVIGDTMLDIRRWGVSSRTSPEDPNCKVICDTGVSYELGGAGNVANWLAACPELEVKLISLWADDAEGLKLSVLCDNAGIWLSEVFRRESPFFYTTRKERICIQNENGNEIRQIARCDRDSHSTPLYQEVGHFNGCYTGWADLIVIADYDKGLFHGNWGDELRNWAAEEAKRIPVVVNSKRPEQWESKRVNSLICNYQEALKGWRFDSDNSLHQRLKADLLTITMGKGGAECFWNQGKQKLWMGSQASEVVDVCGAGDAFTAGFAYQMLLNRAAGVPEQPPYPGVAAMLHRGQGWSAHCVKQIGCGKPLGEENGN